VPQRKATFAREESVKQEVLKARRAVPLEACPQASHRSGDCANSESIDEAN